MEGKTVIYQVFTRLFGNDNSRCTANGTVEENGCGKFNDFTPRALKSIKELGATHVWYTGVIAHATQTDHTPCGIENDHPATVKGRAGSPYAIKDYYDVDPDLAQDKAQRMQEFEALLARTHKAGLKAIIDFVPNHVARSYKSRHLPRRCFDLGQFDDTSRFFANQNNYYYLPGQQLGGSVDWSRGSDTPYTEQPARATGNDRFDAYPTPNDWYETVKLNYGVDYSTGAKHFSPVPNTWVKMHKILEFWASKGIDGFRCDMAEMVPVEFWQWAIAKIKAAHPGILFVAEVYQPALYRDYIGRGGFDLLYDKVGLYDTLRAIVSGQSPASALTGCWQQVEEIQSHMLNFIENHDEQRVASDFYAGDARKGFPAFALCATMNSNPVMLYFGQELGEEGMESEGFSGHDGRTTIFDYWSLATMRRWRSGGSYDGSQLSSRQRELRQQYAHLLQLCRSEKAIASGAFFDPTYANYTHGEYPHDKVYSFLRKADDELILVSVNFGDSPADVALQLPRLAFDTLSVPQRDSAKATELVSGTRCTLALNDHTPVRYTVAPHQIAMFKTKI